MNTTQALMFRPWIYGFFVMLLGSDGSLVRGARPDGDEVIVDGPVGHRIDEYLGRMVRFGFSGAVLLESEGRVVLAKGYGLAFDALGRPCTTDTVFPLASVSKQFTAVAVLRLEAEGLLNTSDTLEQFFPDVPEDKRDITIAQLLSHTSGLVSGTTSVLSDRSRQGLLSETFAAPLLFVPGTSFEYSNYGYGIAAAIVEEVSRSDFGDYLRRQVLAEAGMKSAGVRFLVPGPANLAHRYVNGVDRGTVADGSYPDWNRLGSGAVHASVYGMYQWKRALLSGDILPEALRDQMFTPGKNGYGFGVRVEETGSGTVVQHDGGSSEGYACDFRFNLNSGDTLVVFSNRDGERVLFGDGLAERLWNMLSGALFPLPPLAERGEPKELQSYTGTYRSELDVVAAVEMRSGMMRLTLSGQAAIDAALGLSDKDREVFAMLSARSRVALDNLDKEEAIRVLSTSLRDSIQGRVRQGEVGMGSFRGFSVLGTAPDWIWGGSDCMTIIEMRFERGTHHCRLHWKDDRVIALGGAGVDSPGRLWVVPSATDPGEFVGFHPPTGASPTIRFERDGGHVRGLSIGGMTLARRLE